MQFLPSRSESLMLAQRFSVELCCEELLFSYMFLKI